MTRSVESAGTGPGGSPPADTTGGARAGSWAQVEEQAPELARRVRAAFGVRKHCTMATLRIDGSPRISGTEVQFVDGELEFGSMPGARKARDLQRDGRVALHSPTVDPPEGDEAAWAGEAKVAGRAVEVGSAPGHSDDSHRFRIDLTEVVHTGVGPGGDALLITSWHAGRGVQERRRA